MKLIIELDDDVFTRLFDNGVDMSLEDLEAIEAATRNGVPLADITDEQISDAFQIAIANYWEERSKYLTPPPIPCSPECQTESLANKFDFEDFIALKTRVEILESQMSELITQSSESYDNGKEEKRTAGISKCDNCGIKKWCTKAWDYHIFDEKDCPFDCEKSQLKKVYKMVWEQGYKYGLCDAERKNQVKVPNQNDFLNKQIHIPDEEEV